jgi:hypothetical protein
MGAVVDAFVVGAFVVALDLLSEGEEAVSLMEFLMPDGDGLGWSSPLVSFRGWYVVFAEVRLATGLVSRALKEVEDEEEEEDIAEAFFCTALSRPGFKSDPGIFLNVSSLPTTWSLNVPFLCIFNTVHTFPSYVTVSPFLNLLLVSSMLPLLVAVTVVLSVVAALATGLSLTELTASVVLSKSSSSYPSS